MSPLKLREKTHAKFVAFFEDIARKNKGREFELAFSEIQYETGTASVTLKRALQSLEADGWLEIKPGRNSRYARFRVLSISEAEQQTLEEEAPSKESVNTQSIIEDFTNQIDALRRRIRTQEMAIALLQERLAEVEDKLLKR